MTKTQKPIFAQALGQAWMQLAPAVRAHYNLHPASGEELVLKGIMSVYYPRPAILLLGFARLFGGLVLIRQMNIKVHVKNSSRPYSQAMFWHRTFFRANRKRPAIFRSRMEYAGGNDVIEYVGSNIGIRMRVTEVTGALHYESVGYVIKIGSLLLPLPGHMLLGRAIIIEEASSEHSIKLDFSIRHPLWGEIYRYSGQFELQKG